MKKKITLAISILMATFYTATPQNQAQAQESQKTWQGGAWATESQDQTKWIRAAEASYTNTPQKNPIDNDTSSVDYIPQFPEWIQKSLRDKKFRIPAGTLGSAQYQVFSLTPDTRTIVFTMIPQDDCDGQGNGSGEPAPISCPLHVFTVKKNGTSTPISNAKGCYFDTSQMYRPDATKEQVLDIKKKNGIYYKFNNEKKTIEETVVKDGSPVSDCSFSIPVPKN